MADMEVSGPAWNRLREIRGNADEAERRDKLSYEKWKALLEEGMVAAQGNPDLLDFMVPYARPGWRERLAKDQEAKAIESTQAKNACSCAGDSRAGSGCGVEVRAAGGAATSCD